MKLAGITWWRNNYGSILQAYALQQYLINTEHVDYTIINQYSKKMASIENLKAKLRSVGLKGTLKRVIFRFGLKKLRNRVNALQKFVDSNLVVTDRVFDDSNIVEANEMFDGFICGSDQIWNPANTSFDSIYWLDFAEKGKMKVSYAPSIGMNSATSEQLRKIKSNLSTFHAISSREETGTRLINRALGENRCETVLDPTMIVDKKIWDGISSYRMVKRKYIFVYLLKSGKEERKLIERFAEKVKLPIVTIPFLDGESIVLYDFKFGTIKIWDANPADFISAIRWAEYVFTDSFHCSVFSCIYHKTFFTFPKKGKMQMNRLTWLQTALKTGNRMVRKGYSVDRILNKEKINWETVDEQLVTNQKKSRTFIHSALNEWRPVVNSQA